MGTSGDVLNKARFFDNDIKIERQVSATKIIPILVSFTMKMETTLRNIWKLVSGSSTGKSSQAPPPPLMETPQKENTLEEVKIPLPQWPAKELVAEVAQEVPPTEFPAATSLAAKKKKVEKDLETPRTMSSEPSSQ